MPRTARLIVHLFLGTFLLSGVFSCSEGSAPTSSTEKVRVQLNWFPEPEFGGLYAAQANGFFADEGLDVELLKGGPDVPAPQMLASGRVEFAVVAAPQLMTLRARGGNATAVFATFQKYPRGILVRADSGYEDLESFWKSDGKVMAQDGLAFIKWLKKKYGKTDLSFVPYGGSLAPFISNTVQGMQCFATAEPVQLEMDGVQTSVFLLADEGYNPYVALIAVNDKVLEERPEMVNRFVKALRRGWDAYLATPAKTNALIKSLNPDLKSKVLELATVRLADFVQSDVTREHAPGWMVEERWETLGRQLVELGELTEDERKRVGSPFINPALEKNSE